MYEYYSRLQNQWRNKATKLSPVAPKEVLPTKRCLSVFSGVSTIICNVTDTREGDAIGGGAPSKREPILTRA